MAGTIDPTVAIPASSWTIDTPIEVRMQRRGSIYVLWAWVDNGIIHNTLSIGGQGTRESLSNLQSKATFPRKAVPGWQAEVVEFCRNGLYEIVAVR